MMKWIAPTILGLLVTANVALLACGSADTWVTMNTPVQMQAVTGVAPKIVVADALPEFERWELEVRLATEEFMDEYLDRMAVVSYINATVGALSALGNTALTASPLAPLAPLAVGAIALLVRPPGTKAREKRIGDAAEARGIKIGKNGGPP